MSISQDHLYPFDPTGGLTLDELHGLRPPEAPTNFEAFWRARYAEALDVDPRPQLSESWVSHPDWTVYDLQYTSTEGFDIGGWLLQPRGKPVRRGLVVGHGYGGRDEPDFDIPVEETAVLFPCARGLSRSCRPGIPAEASGHVLHGIDDAERYILGGCVADLWLAVSAIIRLFPEVAGRVGYSGTSFGGGIGALALAVDDRIARGHLVVPTFGNMPLWLTLPTTGSAASVQSYRANHPDVVHTLRLFDSATAAARISVPMLVAVARFDPVVAPPCQFTLANALPTSNRHDTVILDAGHVDYPGQERQHALLAAQVRDFFGAT